MLIALNSPSAPGTGPVLASVHLALDAVTPATVTVSYETLPGNQPKLYGNFLAIWQSTVIPWSAPPLKRQALAPGGQSGATTLSGLGIQRKPYIVGYGVGAEITSIAASLALHPDREAVVLATTIEVPAITPDSLVIHYRTLPGYRPLTAGNWIGLWQGQASPFYSGDPIARAVPDHDFSEGYIAMDGLVLTFGTTYTLVYFAGAGKTEAAAILTFTTASRS
ncbi:MAG TPA: hypothetical protein VGB57_09310 [Allosphingosinicella sp.]|jgi:hypothetical protein